MGYDAKRAYFFELYERYKNATKRLKRTILDEFCTVCGYHRKHAIRLLNQPISKRRPKKHGAKRGRKPVYHTEQILKPLSIIWQATNYICSKKLKAALPVWLPHYKQAHRAFSPQDEQRLLSMSPTTMDRLLKAKRVAAKHKGACGTKPGS